MTVAYQGVPGGFGHEASRRFLPDHKGIARPGFADVIECVTSGEAEFGVLPVRNSIAGPVREVTALLERCDLRVVGEHRLPIRLHLLALPEVGLADIDAVVSHPMALAQCQAAISALGLRQETAANTGAAAQQLADRNKAALASEAAANAYGLQILQRDLQDRSDSETTFVVLAR